MTLVEPGSFATDWGGDSAVHSDGLAAYQPARDAMAARRGQATSGSPMAAATALLEVVDADEPPLRILFGSQAYDTVQWIYPQRLSTWAAWEKVSRAADGD